MLHLDVDYVHMSTRNRIVQGEEVSFDATGVTNDDPRAAAGQTATRVALGSCSRVPSRSGRCEGNGR